MVTRSILLASLVVALAARTAPADTPAAGAGSPGTATTAADGGVLAFTASTVDRGTFDGAAPASEGRHVLVLGALVTDVQPGGSRGRTGRGTAR